MLKEVPLTLRVRGMTQRTRGKKREKMGGGDDELGYETVPPHIFSLSLAHRPRHSAANAVSGGTSPPPRNIDTHYPAGEAMQMHTPPTNAPSFRLATSSIDNTTLFRQPVHRRKRQRLSGQTESRARKGTTRRDTQPHTTMWD